MNASDIAGEVGKLQDTAVKHRVSLMARKRRGKLRYHMLTGYLSIMEARKYINWQSATAQGYVIEYVSEGCVCSLVPMVSY